MPCVGIVLRGIDFVIFLLDANTRTKSKTGIGLCCHVDLQTNTACHVNGAVTSAVITRLGQTSARGT